MNLKSFFGNVILLLVLNLNVNAQKLLITKNNGEYRRIPVKVVADFDEDTNLAFGPNEYLNDGKDHIIPEVTVTDEDAKLNSKSLKISCGEVVVWGSSFFMKSQKDVVLEEGKGIGVWLKSNDDVVVDYHFKDAVGTEFYVPKEYLEGGKGWQYSYAMPDSYRKTKATPSTLNPSIVSPVQFIGLSFFARNDNTIIYVDGLETMQEMEYNSPASVYVMPQKLANIYNLGETITCYASSSSDKIKLILKNYQGKFIDEKEGDTSLNWELPSDKLGQYELIILSYKNEIKDENLVDSRLFAYGIIDGDINLNEKLGVTTHIQRYYYSDKYADLMALMGIGYNRMNLMMENNQDKSGNLTVSSFTKGMINICKEKGIRFKCLLNDKTPPVTQELEDKFQKYCEDVLDTYGEYMDKVEIWNEWSNATGTYTQYKSQQTAENYSKLLNGIYPDLKAKFPNVTFIGLGGENPQVFKEHIEDMFDEGVAQNMDAFSLHPYRQPYAPDDRNMFVHQINMAEQVKEIIELSKSKNGSEKVYITEIGYPTHLLNWGISDYLLSEYMVKTLACMHTTEGVEQVDWYNLYNEDEMGARGNYKKIDEDPQLHFGLYYGAEFNFAVKPVAMAFRAYSKLTYGLKGVAQYDNGEGFSKMTFEDQEHNTLEILWDNKAEQEITVSLTDKVVYDLMGNEISHDGAIKLTKEPVYIASKNLSFSSINKTQENFAKVYPNPTGGKVQIEITDFNSTNNLIAELRNMNGSLVDSRQLNYPKSLIDIEDQPMGIYILSLIANRKVAEFKIVKN